MAISRVEDIISEVNSQTDAEKLAYLLDYHSEKVQITPTQVKCFCPLHHEQAFRSLILDVKGHSYRCTMKRCPGFEGGTFVHLWGVYRSMAPLEAALSLAEKLKLNIDVQALRLLGGNLIGKAKEATASGDLAAARAAIDQAVAFDPKSIEAARLSAEIWYKSGDRDRATEEYTRAIDLALEAKDFAAAHSVLGPLTASDPKSIEFAQRKVSLAKAESDPQAISESLLRLAELYGETGSVTSELAALDEVLAAAGQDARLLERVAEIHKKAERSAKMMEILDRLIPIYEGQGDWNKVLAALQVRLDHSPDDADLREKMAEALMRTGKTEAAAARILELAEHHRLTGTVIKAQSLIRKLVEAQPENTQALEKLAALSAEGGQRKDAVESYRKLAAVARKGGRMDEAARYLGRARAIDPDDHALRRDLAETQLSSNRVEEGISELFGLADVFLSESDPAEGFKILDRIAELAPDDAARHIEIGRCLEAAGYDEKAVEGFATFVKRVQKAGRHEDALAVCKEARRLAPRNEFFIEAAMESLMAAGRKTEAVTVLRDAARSLMEVENWRAAEAMLGRAAKIDRTDPGIKTDMAEILERAGRTEDAVRLWREVAQTHRAAENSEQTLIAARQMLRLDPANVEAKAMLAEALEATGETREALELWKESVATLLQRDANSGPALKVLEHILTLAPDDMMMIAQTAQLKFRVLGADKAKPAFDLWIEKARRTLDPKLLLLALQSSVEAYPKEIAWRSHLAELLIAREQSAEAIPHLESLLAAYKLLGKEDGDYRRILDQLVALCPDRLDLRVEWADALAKGGEVKRALEIFDEIARQYLARGDQEHGLQLLQRSLKYQPENREILLRAAELLERLNRRPEAIAAYEQLVDLSRRLDTWRSNVAAIDKLLMLCPDRHDLRLELAQAYESHGDIENAVDQYHRVAQALVKKDIKGNQTLEICERLVMIAPPEMRAAREMLVDCYLARKDIEKAKGELERMGDQALREGDLNRGESIFRRIQEIDPQDIGSGERLGKLYEAKGQTEQAADAYRQVLALYEKKKDVPRIISVLGHLKGLAPKDLDLRMRLAQTLATLPERADETAEEFYELIALAIGQEKPNIARAALKEAEPFFEERWDFRFKTIQLFTRAQEAPKTIKAWKTFAEQALAAGQNAMAREAATEGIQLAPADIQLLEVRIQANQRLNDVDAAEADLLTMARQNTSEGKHAKAEASLNRALELKPNDINLLGLLAQSQVSQQHLDQAVATLHKLAEIHRAGSDFENAIARAKEITQLQPQAIESRDYLAALLIEGGDSGAALEIWREISEQLASSGDLDGAVKRLEDILIQSPRDIEALRRAADLTRESKGTEAACAAYHKLLDVLIEEAKPKAIEAEFKRVLELEADQLSLAEKYALYLHNTGKNRKAAAEFLRIAKVYEDSLSDLEEAIRVIRLLRSLEPADLSVTEEEAALLEKLGRKDEAVAVLRDLALSYSNEGSAAKSADCVGHCAEILSDDHIAQIEAAEAYERLKQADKATQYFMRAIALHQSAGSLDANIPLLKRVIQLNPADLDIPEALARTFEQTGQPAAAVTQWLELGAEHEKRNEGSRAIEIYRHVKTIEAEELESRRRLARICAQTGDNAGALTELREIVPITLGLGDEDETISVLKRILELDAEDAPSMVILADQYRRLAWDKELFSLLLKLEDLYCRTDQTDSAISVLEELRSLRPDDLQLTRQSFDLLVKTRKNAEAASVGTSLVETFLQHDDAAKAKELMRLVDDIEPDNVERRISLAHLADSHGHSELALEEFRRGCEELAEYGAIEPALQLAEAGLKSFADDIGLRRAKISLLKQAEKADLAIEEMLSLASLYETQGEDEQSYKVLDEILADYPESIPTHQQIVNMALRSGDMERTSEHLIQLAEINYVAGNLTDSIRALEQLLELQPERTELRTRLAELHHEAGNTPRAREVWFHAAKELRAAKQLDQAIEIYQRVRENYPDDVDTLANLTACLREGGKDDAYLSHAMELSESYTQTGDFDRATHILEELGQRFPKNIAIWERLAAAHAESGDQDGAVRCFKAMFEIHQSQRRYDLAKACLEQAYQLRPDDVEILQQLGEICLRLNQRAEGLEHLSKAALRMKELSNFDEARQIIERIMKIDPTNLETRRILGSICEEMGDFDNAVKNYALAARGFSERRENVQAIQVFEHLLKLDPGLSEEREAYAHVLERENRIEESGQQYLLLIKNLKEDADPRQVIRYCRQILKENPYHVEAHIYLYKVYDQTKKPRLALEEAQWLADYYISTGDMDEAEAYIRRGLEASPGEIELRKRFVDILIETNRQGEAADNLRELASSAQAQGDVRTARWALSRACEVMPENLEYRQQLAQLLETAGELAEARRVRIEIMQIYLAQGEMEKARAMGERVVESAPNDEELRTHVAQIFENAELPEVAAFHYTYMAKAALQNEDHKRVLKITDHILKIKPRHIPARECLVQSLMASGDGAGAANHSRELYNLYLEAGDLEDAHRVLKIVIQNRPSDPEPRRLMVDLYRKMGKMDQVVEQLRRLAEICANNSDIDNAVAALKELIQIRPDDTRARARYIDLYSQMGDESELYDDFLQLARAYRKEGSVVEASQVYEKLLQTHPERTECREQFVDFLFEQGQVNRGIEEARTLVDIYLQSDLKVEAGRTLEKALGKSPADTQMRHQLATLQIRTNRRGLALETLRGLLKQYEQLNNDAKQVEIIQQILEIDSLNVELRQRLAELLAKIGDVDRAKQQRMMLAQQYLDRQLFDLAEREYRRIIEVDPNDLDVWRRVVETHLQIGTEAEIVPDLQAMADLCLKAGESKQAVDILQKLKTIQPKDIGILSRYIEAYVEIGQEEDLVNDYLLLAELLTQAKQMDAALKIYRHLQELSPENSQVRARVQAAESSPTKRAQTQAKPIPTVLTPHPGAVAKGMNAAVPQTPPPAPEPAETSGPQLEKEIRKYENILKLNPENPAVRAQLAERIARTGRMKEADEHWAQAANDFMNRGDFDRCIQIYEDLVSRHPDEARLRERLSRAILKRESLNAIGSIGAEGPITGAGR